MIGSLSGVIVDATPSRILLSVHGVGYDVIVPLSTYERVKDSAGEVSIFTHLHVREDILQLYGFVSRGEKDLFQKVITISGIGPKVAIGILSSCSPPEFIAAIRDGNISRLKALPGIGKKTAERLVVELKDKIGGLGISDDSIAGSPRNDAYEEARLALLSLGYKNASIEKALPESNEDASSGDVESLIKLALKNL